MRRIAIVFTLCLGSVVASAQDSLRQTDVYRFADAVVYTAAQPVRWEGRQWLTFGGVLAGTAALMLVDEPVNDLFNRVDNRFMDGVAEVGFHYGKPYSAFTTTGGFYLAGLVFNNRWAKDTGLALGVTLLTSGALQTFLKDAVGRARPGTGVGSQEYRFFSKSAAYHSFPSGHMSVAFGISIVLARRVESLPLKILFYSFAGATFLSRLYTDAHWLSDMAFGAALPYFCAETAFRRLGLNESPIRKANRKMSFHFTPGINGFSLTGRW